MTWLLDGNLLVALTIDSHVHHGVASSWFGSSRRRFATCAMTQGTLLRLHMTIAEDRSAAAAWATLEAIIRLKQHEYWADAPSYTEIPHRHLQGPKQVTDAYLAQLARIRGARLATLDSALVALHPDVGELVLG